MYYFFQFLSKVFPVKSVYAHCDIPCGVYDPCSANVAARGAYAMVEKLTQLAQPTNPHDQQEFVRMVKAKEEQAELCKKELLILWTDYFKPEHLEMFPDLHEKFWNAAKQCSKVKRDIHMDDAKKLLDMVDEIAGMFHRAEEAKKKA